MKKSYLSADEFLRDSWLLAAKIAKSDWKPDTLIALWRGGAFVGMAVHEFLKLKGYKLKHYPLKSASYSGIGQNEGEVVFTLGKETFSMINQGEKVLVVDDVFDTGKTAQAVKKEIEKAGADFRFASVYWKPSKNLTSMKPDYFTKELDDAWIVFPHELEGLSAAELEEKDPFLKGIA